MGGQEKEWIGCFLDDLRAFGINADQWTTAAQDESEWRRTAEQGEDHSETDRCGKSQGWTTASSNMPEPDVTGRAKERIAQSKRNRAGSLAIVD